MQNKSGAPVLSLKALEDNGTFSGYGSIFGNVDSYRDIVMPGAFQKSIEAHKSRKSKPKMFWQHDPSAPIGSWTDFKEDDTGLLMSGRLNMDVQKGREAYALLKSGDIDGLSIGYRTLDSEQDKDSNTLKLTELDLVEVSIVSIGANDEALVSEVKSQRKIQDFDARLRAGEQPTVREWENYFKAKNFSNSEAERVIRLNFKTGQGEPDTHRAFWNSLRA